MSDLFAISPAPITDAELAALLDPDALLAALQGSDAQYGQGLPTFDFDPDELVDILQRFTEKQRREENILLQFAIVGLVKFIVSEPDFAAEWPEFHPLESVRGADLDQRRMADLMMCIHISLRTLAATGIGDEWTERVRQCLQNHLCHCFDSDWNRASFERLAIAMTMSAHEHWAKIEAPRLPSGQFYRILPLAFLPDDELWSALKPAKSLFTALEIRLPDDMLRMAALEARARIFYDFDFEYYMSPGRSLDYVDIVNMICTMRPYMRDIIGQDADSATWRRAFGHLSDQLKRHAFADIGRMVMLASCFAQSVQRVSYREYQQRLRYIMS